MSQSIPETGAPDPIKFAYWVSNLSGGQVVSKIEQRTGYDIDYNVRLAQLAEAAGFDFALAPTRYLGGYRADGQHDPWVFSTALLRETKKLQLITAVLTGLWHPVVVAKLGATAAHVSDGRWHVNILAGWFQAEYEALGLPWLPHDERYRRAEEFIQVLQGVWNQEDFSHQGEYFRINNYTLKPRPDVSPLVFQGGSSTAARQMAGRSSDWYFTNGGALADIKPQVDQVKGYAAEHGRKLQVGINAFIIARETEAEAREVHREIVRLADVEAVNGFAHAVRQAGSATADGVGNWAKSDFEDLVQPNDGFKTNLIGTPEQIAERIVAFKEIGVDLILAGFLHYQEEIEYFGRRVLPLVRELEAARGLRPSPETALTSAA